MGWYCHKYSVIVPVGSSGYALVWVCRRGWSELLVPSHWGGGAYFQSVKVGQPVSLSSGRFCTALIEG